MRVPVGGAASESAIVARLVLADEIHWSTPCGNPLSKYGWKPAALLEKLVAENKNFDDL